MRSGCVGCLTGVIVGVWLAGVLLGGGWVVSLALDTPPLDTPVTSAADAAAAQRKVFALSRASGPTATPIVLSEREVNALLGRTLADELPLAPTIVHLRADDRAEIAGRMPVEDLLGVWPLTTVRDWVPAGSRQRRVWLRTSVRVQLEPGRHVRVRLVPLTAAIGRLPIPAGALPWVLEPGALRYLRLTLPERARGLRIEPGRVVITTAD